MAGSEFALSTDNAPLLAVCLMDAPFAEAACVTAAAEAVETGPEAARTEPAAVAVAVGLAPPWEVVSVAAASAEVVPCVAGGFHAMSCCSSAVGGWYSKPLSTR